MTLRQLDTEGYFRTMERILKTYVLAAAEKGGSLVLSKEQKAIEDGFILVYGGIEENCTLKALLDAKKDELQDKVNEILFL